MSVSVEKKVVLVTYPVGRIGSSATMGLLKLAGIHVGDVSVKPTAMNPKGGYESPAIARFLAKTYPGIYGSTDGPPSPEEVNRIAASHRAEYFEIHREVFGEGHPIAVKSPRMLLTPFFSDPEPGYTPMVIVLHRDPAGQSRSILKIWGEESDKQEITREDYILSYLKEWADFLDRMRSIYGHLPYLDVHFENLIAKPWETMRRISDFVGIRCPDEGRIQEWIDPSLVDRKKNSL